MAVQEFRMDPAAARDLIEAGRAVVLDVTSEWVDGAVRTRIPGAVYVSPRDVLDPNRHAADVRKNLPPLSRDKVIIAYCTCPGEEASVKLAGYLRQDGYEAWAIRGGLPAWRAAGFALETKWSTSSARQGRVATAVAPPPEAA